MDHATIVKYLGNGGLIDILGHCQAKAVWLKQDNQGTITYTFVNPGRNGAGGHPVPNSLSITRGKHIFSQKVDEAKHFIMGFGLDENEAKSVIEMIGTA